MGKRFFLCVFFTISVALQEAALVYTKTTEASTTATDENMTDNTETKKPKGTDGGDVASNATTTTTTKPEISTLATGLKSQDRIEEFENSLNEKQRDKHMIFRSEASNNRTLHLTSRDSGKRYEATICVQSSGEDKVQLQVIRIRYSNDGPSDEIRLELNGNHLGTVTTEEVYNGGLEWNVFKDTRPIGDAVILVNGNHTLSMTVNTDKWGAEFDTMTIRVHNQDPVVDILCKSELA